MSYFKAVMHQIWLRLGLCPRSRSGSLHHSPDPVDGFKGPVSKGKGKGGEGKEREGSGRDEKGAPWCPQPLTPSAAYGLTPGYAMSKEQKPMENKRHSQVTESPPTLSRFNKDILCKRMTEMVN